MEDFFGQSWDMLVGRASGPFAFRLILQPLTAAVIACRAGWRDARAGRPAYGWAVITDSANRHGLIREGWSELARVFAVAVMVDLLYEVIVFRRIYPGQSVIVATLLALLPYPLIRGLMNRMVRRWVRTHGETPRGIHAPTSSRPAR
jgi:hypothetical protein